MSCNPGLRVGSTIWCVLLYGLKLDFIQTFMDQRQLIIKRLAFVVFGEMSLQLLDGLLYLYTLYRYGSTIFCSNIAWYVSFNLVFPSFCKAIIFKDILCIKQCKKCVALWILTFNSFDSAVVGRVFYPNKMCFSKPQYCCNEACSCHLLYQWTHSHSHTCSV